MSTGLLSIEMEPPVSEQLSITLHVSKLGIYIYIDVEHISYQGDVQSEVFAGTFGTTTGASQLST